MWVSGIRQSLLYISISLLPIALCAQGSDSFLIKITVLQKRLESGKLNDTAYLKETSKIAAQGYGRDDFEKLLRQFYKIAFKDSQACKYRVVYYRHLAMDAFANNKTGRIVYFLEKEAAEKKKINKKYTGDLALAYYLLSVYRNVAAYDKCITTYNSVLALIEQMPAKIGTDSTDTQCVSDALAIIAAMMPVYGTKKDSAGVNRLTFLAVLIYDAAMQRQGKYAPFIRDYQYYYYDAQYGQYVFAKGYSPVSTQYLHKMQETLLAKDYRGGREVKYLLSELYFRLAQSYINLQNTDSARYYIRQQVLLGLENDLAAQPATKLDYFETMSQIETQEKNYEAAFENIRKAYLINDTALRHVMADRDNNLYAGALAEDRQRSLDEATIQQKESEAFNRLLVGCILLVILMGCLLMVWTKWRQKKKYLEFKLNIARNLHDETGPILLYAKALAKKEREQSDPGTAAELEKYISDVMETIRSVSHDLKSEKQSTIHSFFTEQQQQLKKMSALMGYTYEAKILGSDNYISHLQHTHIKAVLQELLTNTIKHASFTSIMLLAERLGKELRITYSDNGKGPNPDNIGNGIGMANIHERVSRLHGEIVIENHYPNGSKILITVPLI